MQHYEELRLKVSNLTNRILHELDRDCESVQQIQAYLIQRLNFIKELIKFLSKEASTLQFFLKTIKVEEEKIDEALNAYRKKLFVQFQIWISLKNIIFEGGVMKKGLFLFILYAPLEIDNNGAGNTNPTYASPYVQPYIPFPYPPKK